MVDEESNRNVVLVDGKQLNCGGGVGGLKLKKKMSRSEIPEEKEGGGRGLVQVNHSV